MMDDMLLSTIVLGLVDFELTAAEQQDGEVWLRVQTTTRTAICPDCCELAVLHDRREVQARDMPLTGRACRLVWSKRVWRCLTEWCRTSTWTEQRFDVLQPRHVLTERARGNACREIGRDHTLAEIAAAIGVGRSTLYRHLPNRP